MSQPSCSSRATLIFKKAIRWLLGSFRGIVPLETLARFEMFLFLNYWPNLARPRSFNEKIYHWMLSGPHQKSSMCADKCAVREYVLSKTNRPDILNDVYFVGADASKIPFDELPNKFVIKATHGSGWNIFVHDKAAANIPEIVSRCRKWMDTKHSVATRNVCETHYDPIVPRIIIEKYMEDATYGIPIDYKFFCFGGRPVYVQVDLDRFVDHRRNFYDVAWREMDVRVTYLKGKPVPRPAMLNDMMDVAAKLATGFGFCRVDLYSPDDKRVLFGEMTFAPGSGLERFDPPEWDYRFGALWEAPAGEHPSSEARTTTAMVGTP